MPSLSSWRPIGTTPEVDDWVRRHKTMVVLGVKNEQELERWERGLKARGIPFSTFVEPDIGDRKTAMAIHPMADPRLFKRLQLL